ncbi:hypothetical protein IEO70_08550 [Bacillus sp. AGMB 02131]|uniref:Uncharacterized protein n=1 Tax=Peribacillus faecalis TaxID=2772559 RepID=A0A927HAY1_9BACI|nr:hypothetical protein [Peribacillus faecalis]MBD3108414.1 hypothetical protein [Peribacillus faecalis]
MNKPKVGTTLGILSILPLIISINFFFIERGPNADIYAIITIFSVLSIIGILLSILSIIYLWMSKEHKSKLLIGLVGLIANLLVLVFTFFLLLAMGIGEP